MTCRPPIIIIGMHRSGTTMVTRLLMQLGLFAGTELEDNSEAVFFLKLNDWLMHQCGAAWDHPEPMKYLLAETGAENLAANCFRVAMASKLTKNYLGLWKYLRIRTPGNLDIPWGWKDPRNTFTLPVWLHLFPDARVVHVLRHGVDVAKSLQTRSMRGLELCTAPSPAAQPVPDLESCLRDRITDSVRCLSLEGGFSLWEEYSEQARSLVDSLGKCAMEVRYETVLEQPTESLRALATFCDLPTTDEAILECSKLLVPGRTFAYKSNESLVSFAKRHADSLRANGYPQN